MNKNVFSSLMFQSPMPNKALWAAAAIGVCAYYAFVLGTTAKIANFMERALFDHDPTTEDAARALILDTDPKGLRFGSFAPLVRPHGQVFVVRLANVEERKDRVLGQTYRITACLYDASKSLGHRSVNGAQLRAELARDVAYMTTAAGKGCHSGETEMIQAVGQYTQSFRPHRRDWDNAVLLLKGAAVR